MSEGIKGNGAVFTLTLAPGAPIDYSDDLKTIKITSADKDDSDLTFAEAAAGLVKDYTLETTSIQSTEADSLWRFLWENPGAEFECVYGPNGNAVPTDDKPHFNMTVKATGKPEIGGDAARNGSRYSFDYSFDVTAGPTLDDGS